MAANTYGRQVVVPLTNKSGAGVIAGDVVVVDTGNNDAFTTSTSGAFTGGVGIAQETIANNAVGRVLISGYAALVLTSASVTRGNFGKTHTVAKQAVDAGASRVVGTFCQFLTGGTTPDAMLFGWPDASSATGSIATDAIWDAAGDLVQGTGANTAAKLSAGTAGQVLTSAGAAAANVWAGFRGAKAVTNATQTLTTSTAAAVAFAGADLFDTDAFHNPASNNTRMTIPAGLGGYYLAIASIGFAANATGYRFAAFRVNGAGSGEWTKIAASASEDTSVVASTILLVAATDYIEVFASQSSGGNLNLDNGVSYFSIARLGV